VVSSLDGGPVGSERSLGLTFGLNVPGGHALCLRSVPVDRNGVSFA